MCWQLALTCRLRSLGCAHPRVLIEDHHVGLAGPRANRQLGPSPGCQRASGAWASPWVSTAPQQRFTSIGTRALSDANRDGHTSGLGKRRSGGQFKFNSRLWITPDPQALSRVARTQAAPYGKPPTLWTPYQLHRSWPTFRSGQSRPLTQWGTSHCKPLPVPW